MVDERSAVESSCGDKSLNHGSLEREKVTKRARPTTTCLPYATSRGLVSPAMRIPRTETRTLVIGLALAVGMAGAACDKGSAPASTSSGGSTPEPSASTVTTTSSAAPSASAASAEANAAGADAEAAQNAEDEQVNDELLTHHRHHHQGLAGFVIGAVETLGVAPDQQTAIDGIRKDFRVKMKPLHEANLAVITLLADGIATGTIDKAKVDAAVAKAGTASGAVQAATADVLNQLYKVLRPEQRTALVDKVDAQWATWREANDPGSDTTKRDRHINHLAKEIGLTSDQVDKLRTSLDATKDAKKAYDPAAAEAYVKAFDTAFVTDTFDAKKLPASGPESSRLVAWGAERMAWFYEALAPILTADQRPKVADKLRQRAAGPDSKDKQ
jgi:Spy/CpxP family protein refolding chaperone